MKTELTKKLERAIWGETHKMGTYEGSPVFVWLSLEASRLKEIG